MTPPAWVLAAGALLAAALPVDAAPLEIDVLEAYLAEHDRAPRTPHCARHHGFAMTPAGAMRSPAGATNRVLEEHFAFHHEQRDQPGAGFRPSPGDEDRYGIVFFEWHRHFLGKYEAWRLENGHGPVEPWDPGTPMPEALAYPYPERACTDGRNEDPQVPLPSWATVEGGDETDPIFGHARLCDFKDLNQLGKSVAIEYHWRFHASIGGDMVGGRGPLDPAFWAGHQFINRLMDAWWAACDGAAEHARAGVAGETPRAVPGAGAAALAVAALVAAALHGRRGRGA